MSKSLKSNSAQSLLVDYHGAAEMLQVSVSTVEKLKAAGKVPFVLIGRSVRFSRAELERWITERMQVVETVNENGGATDDQ